MNQFVYQLKIQFKMDIRDKGTLVTYYLVPLLFYFLMSGVFVSINPESRQTLVATMSIFSITMGTILGLPAPIVRMREMNVLKGTRVLGLPPWSLLTTQAASCGIHLLLIALVITLTAPFLYQADWPKSMPLFGLTTLILLSTQLAIGLLIGVMSRSQSVAILLSQAVFLPTMLLGGIMFPSALLPEPLRIIGKILPSTHFMQLFQDWAYQISVEGNTWVSLIILLAVGGLALLIAVKRYRAISRQA